MARKYILLIEDEKTGVFCCKGEGTVEQVKNDIEKLVKHGIEPANLEVVPVIGNRIQKESLILGTLLGATILGLGFCTVKIYENLRKRTRKRGQHSDS